MTDLSLNIKLVKVHNKRYHSIILYFWFWLLGLSGIVICSFFPINGATYFLRTHFLSFTPSISAISETLLGVRQNSKTFSWGEMNFDLGCSSFWLGVWLGVTASTSELDSSLTPSVNALLNHIVRLTNGAITLISGAGRPCSLQLSIITLQMPLMFSYLKTAYQDKKNISYIHEKWIHNS